MKGIFVEGGATVQATEADIPADIKELIDLGAYSMEEALAKCSENKGKERRMILKRPFLRMVGEEGSKTLQKGQAVANNNCEQYGSYPIDVIFATFKINKFVIKNAIKNKKFDGELQKINYICAIVRNDLNDVYTRMRNAEMSKKKSEKANTEVQVNEVAEYQRQSEDINESMNETFEELW